MAYVHMRRDFVRDMGDGRTKTYPAGWRGELDDDVAQDAIDGGYTRAKVRGIVAEHQPAPTNAEANDSMTRDELDQTARRVGLDPADYRTKSDIIKAINAA